MRKLLKDFVKDFRYTLEHKKAFLITEKKLTGKNTLSGYLHDVDKLFLYLLFTKKEVSKMHRKYSKHHTGNHKTNHDITQALIDWESARLTKLDKQQTARDYLEIFIPEHKDTYKPLMVKLGLW